jgi:hypothetical protein
VLAAVGADAVPHVVGGSEEAPDFQAATGRPFFDIVTMTRWVYEAMVKRRVHGGFM